jgi:hypothetical protein
MGVYSTNRTSLNGFDESSIVPNENYRNPIGAYQAMIEGFQNDQTMFEAVLINDISEAVSLKSGTVLESELLAVNEAAGGIVDKIKELLTKLLEKIKGLVKSFLAKLGGVFIRDNKAFVDRYKDAILKKDLGKMKYKWSEPTGKSLQLDAIPKVDINGYSSINSVESMHKYVADNFDDNGLMEEILGKIIGTSSISLSEFSKEAHSYLYKDEDEVEGVSTSMLSEIMTELTTSKKTIESMKKDEAAATKAISTSITNIDKARTQISKSIPKDGSGTVKVGDTQHSFGNKDERDLLNLKLNTLYREASMIQTIVTKAFACIMTEYKFNLSQSRRVFAQAAVYNPKSVKEDGLLFEGAGDASDYEVDMIFDGNEK